MDIDKTLPRLIEKALVASRSGDTEELVLFSEYISSDWTVQNELMQFVKKCWQDAETCQLVPSCMIKRGNSTGEHVSATVDILTALLSVDSVWCEVVVLWLSSLFEGNIASQATPLCVSALCNKILAICTVALNDSQLREAIQLLQSVCETCLRFLLDGVRINQADIENCLELIAPCVDALAILSKRRQSVSMSLSSVVSNVIDAILDHQWGGYHSAFLHILCDVRSHLSSKQMDVLKRKIRGAASKLPIEEYASVILAAIRHFESSSDVEWVTSIRRLYAEVPDTEQQTVEAVLEQSLSASSHRRSFKVCLRIVQAIEDAAAAWFSHGLLSEVGQTSKMMHSDKETSTAVDMLPVRPSDIHFVILLMRACRPGFVDTGMNNCDNVESFAMSSVGLLSSSNTDVQQYMAQTSRTFCLLWFVYSYSLRSLDVVGKMVDVVNELLVCEVYDVVCSVLGVVPTEGGTGYSDPTCTGISDRSSSSRGESDRKWTTVTRAADIFFICNYCSRDIKNLVAPCVLFMIAEQGEKMKKKNPLYFLQVDMTSKEMLENIDTSIIHFISDCITGCFAAVSPSRASLFALVMRSVIDYCGGWAEEHPTDNSVLLDSTLSKTEDSFRAIMTGCLTKICTRHSDLLAPLYSQFQSFIPMLAILPVNELENVFAPFLNMVLVQSNPLNISTKAKQSIESAAISDLKGALLMMCRKCAMQPDPLRSLFGLRSLVKLLPALSDSVQLETCQNIIFPSEKSTVSDEILLKESSDLYLTGHKFQQAIHAEVVDLIMSENMRLRDANKCIAGDPAGKVQYCGLSLACISFLRAVLMRKLLSKFVVLDGTGSSFISVLASGPSLFGSEEDRIDLSEFGKVYYSPYSCCDSIKCPSNSAKLSVAGTAAGKSEKATKGFTSHVIKDDIFFLLKSCWNIELLLNADEAIDQLEWLCLRILRGPEADRDMFLTEKTGVEAPLQWSNVIFKGVLNLIENGFTPNVENPDVVLSSSFEDDAGYSQSITDLSSKEHLICVYGAVSGLIDCLSTAGSTVSEHDVTNAGAIAFAAAATSLQSVLNMLISLLEMDGDMTVFIGNAKYFLTKINDIPIDRVKMRAPLPTHEFGSRCFSSCYVWGTLGINSFESIHTALAYLDFQMQMFLLFMRAKMIDDVTCGLSIVLGAMRMTTYLLSTYLKQIALSTVPGQFSTLILGDVYTTVKSLYDRVGGVCVEKRIIAHAVHLYDSMKQRDGCARGQRAKRWKRANGGKASKRKRSIYAEYSDLSDFSDEKDSIFDGAEALEIDPSIGIETANETQVDYKGSYCFLEEAEVSIPLNVSVCKDVKNVARLLSSSIEELRSVLNDKQMEKIESPDVFMSQFLLLRGSRRPSSVGRLLHAGQYEGFIGRSLFALRFEVLETLKILFELHLTVYKSQIYSGMFQTVQRQTNVFLWCNWKDADNLVDRFSNDLAVAVSEGTSLRLLRAYLELLRVLVDVKSYCGDHESRAISDYADVRNVYVKDSMFRVITSCTELTPRITKQITGLLLDKSTAWSDSIRNTVKLLLLCDFWAISSSDGQQQELIMCREAHSSNIAAIQSETLRHLQNKILELNQCKDLYSINILAHAIFMPLVLFDLDSVNWTLQELFGKNVYSAAQASIIISYSGKVSKKRAERRYDEFENKELDIPSVFDRMVHPVKLTFLNVVAKYFQLCSQECKHYLVLLKEIRCGLMNRPGKAATNTENIDAVIGSTSDIDHEAATKSLFSEYDHSVLLAFLSIGCSTSAVTTSSCKIRCVDVLKKIQNLLQESALSASANRRFGFLAKALDELEIFLFFLNKSVLKIAIDNVHDATICQFIQTLSEKLAPAISTFSRSMDISKDISRVDDFESSDEGSVEHNPMKKTRRGPRLRSRNAIVDEWLADEDGDDIYADLENFLVP